jgi:hypothetical protein
LLCSLYAQAKPKEQQLELVKVASLNTVEANKEFQKNVQLVQQQRALAVQLLSSLEKTQDKGEHDKIQKQLDALQKKLNDNNQLMFKTYGFTLNRNYVLTVEKANVHMWVTQDEAQAIKKKANSKDKLKTESNKGLRSLFKGNK